MTDYEHGLIIGKFYPPHLGHHDHITQAAKQAKHLTVVVMAATHESIPLADRVAWLTEAHSHQPNVTITGIACDAPMDTTSHPVWAAQIALMRAAAHRVNPTPVDVVFTSETYGDEMARWFGATHVCVDPTRLVHRTSGTAARQDLAANWHNLHPATRRGLATRIIVVGAESTGTTTMARALADHYRTLGGIWAKTAGVAEYGRDYTYVKFDHAARKAEKIGAPAPALNELVWDSADFHTIAETQTRMENAAAEHGSPVVICDTDAFATSVWEHRYAGPDSHGSARHATTALPRRDIYFLTDHEGVPFEDDGWRDGEHIRSDMTRWFTERLTNAGHSWVLLTGTHDERMTVATRTIDRLLANRMRFADPIDHEPTTLPVLDEGPR